MAVWLGKLEVRIKQIGRGHTKGDAIVYIPQPEHLLLGRPGRGRRRLLYR